MATKRVKAVMAAENPQQLDDLAWPGHEGYQLLCSLPGFKMRKLTPYIRYRTEVDEDIIKRLCRWAQSTKVIMRGLRAEEPPNEYLDIPPFSERSKTKSYGCLEVFHLHSRRFVPTTEYDGNVSVATFEADNLPPSWVMRLTERDERFDAVMISNDSDMGLLSQLMLALLNNSASPITRGRGLYLRVPSLVPKFFAGNDRLREKDTFDLKQCHELMQTKAMRLLNECTFLATRDPSTIERAKRHFTKNFPFLMSLFLMLGGNDYADSIPKITPHDWLAGLGVYMKHQGRSPLVPGGITELAEDDPGFLYLLDIDRLMFEIREEDLKRKLSSYDKPLKAEPYLNRHRFLHLAAYVLALKFPKFKYDDKAPYPDNRRMSPVPLSPSYVMGVINRGFYSLVYYLTEMMPHAGMPHWMITSPELSGFNRENRLEPMKHVDVAVNMTFQLPAWCDPTMREEDDNEGGPSQKRVKTQ